MGGGGGGVVVGSHAGRTQRLLDMLHINCYGARRLSPFMPTSHIAISIVKRLQLNAVQHVSLLDICSRAVSVCPYC